MTCAFCGGRKRCSGASKKQHWFHKQLYVIEDAGEVCLECGERYFHAKVLDQIDRLLAAEHPVKARLQVEVVSLPVQVAVVM